MNARGHNERSFRLDALAAEGVAMIQEGQRQIAEGWLDFGDALRKAQLMFDTKASFDRWYKRQKFTHRGVRVSLATRDATIWAAQNREEFLKAFNRCHGSTPQAAHKWWLRQNREDARDYIYVMTNPAMPGVVKIGMTKCDPDVRAKQLSESSGVPAPFVVSASFRSSQAKAAEVKAHECLSNHRVSANREFFKVSEASARDAIAAAICEVEKE